jgi:hypothetical protein
MIPRNIRNWATLAPSESREGQPTCHAQGRVLKLSSAKMMASARQVATPPFSPNCLAILPRTLELQRDATAGRKTPKMAASRRICDRGMLCGGRGETLLQRIRHNGAIKSVREAATKRLDAGYHKPASCCDYASLGLPRCRVLIGRAGGSEGKSWGLRPYRGRACEKSSGRH